MAAGAMSVKNRHTYLTRMSYKGALKLSGWNQGARKSEIGKKNPTPSEIRQKSSHKNSLEWEREQQGDFSR